MIIKNSFLIVFILSFLVSCSSKESQNIDFSKPDIQIPKPIVNPSNKRGSLYSREGASLFADKKDLQIGDIIQVTIDESLTSDTNNSRALSKNNSSALGGALAAPTTGNTLGSRATGLTNKFNGTFGIGVNTETSNTFKGSSKSAFDESFNTTISVIIEETYLNGNYYIKGSKEMLIDGQKQEIMLSGVIRPYDISPDNTIVSSQIANLKVLYKQDGEENGSLHKSWGTKFLELIWPF